MEYINLGAHTTDAQKGTGMPISTLSGAVNRVIYEDPARGFAIFTVDVPDQYEVTVVGPSHGVAPGVEVRVTGDYQDHPRFGRRFRATTVLPLPPQSQKGLIAFLASGKVAGIGPKIATSLADFFQDELRTVLDGDGSRLSECPGIGKTRAKAIASAWRVQTQWRETFVLLSEFGLTRTQTQRVIRAYGEEGPARIRENPYDMITRVPGIGFRTADAIALKMGIPASDPQRMRAALRHILDVAADDGHVFVDAPTLLENATVFFGDQDEGLVSALEFLAETGDVVIERDHEGDRVFLSALHNAETRAAKKIVDLLLKPLKDISGTKNRDAGVVLAWSQLRALDKLVSAPVAILTGGPGTGKTTLVGELIAIADRNGLKVELAAPTGRAAQRIKETTGRNARTIHRLLEFNPREGGFKRNEQMPIEANWVIVDESSMLDIRLFDRLVAAIAPGTRLTLVGDADQLPPVGPGDPFRNIIAGGHVPTATLVEVFRQKDSSAIVDNAHRIREGLEPETPSGDGLTDFYVVHVESAADVTAMVETLVAERIPKRFGLDPMTDVQVLAPMHRGECGTTALNRALQDRLNGKDRDGRIFAPGDKVIQNRNNYDRDVFNGDIGIVQSGDDEGNLTVGFGDRSVRLEKDDLDDLSAAWAISVHKAQGSEFPAVVVVLHTQHYLLLRRNLLYTAVTRGRKLVILCGNRRALKLALANDRVEERNTRFSERISATLLQMR